MKNRMKSCLCEVIKRIQITHRLDYDKYPIYLHDNIRLGSCKKEPDTVRWIEAFDKDDIVFDIGANIGAYSLIMAKYAKKVYAFEPSIFTFGILARNLCTNKAYNVIPLNIALSQNRQVGMFEYSSIDAGGSGHAFRKSQKSGSNIYHHGILSYSMDGFVNDFYIEPPQHIKIDVDGNESVIIRGADSVLSGKNFKSILLEASDFEVSQIMPRLQELGFREKGKYYLGCDNIYNYLFVKNSK